MKVYELRKLVNELKEIYSAGPVGVIKDLDNVAAALEQHDDSQLDQFLALVQQTLSSGDPEARVGAHLAALAAADTDQERFDRALSDLESDKELKNTDLDRIGAIYASHKQFGKAFRSRSAKIQKIKETFRNKVDFAIRAETIDRQMPWQ